MRVERDWLRNVVFDFKDARRFTQDSPILPDVWLAAGMFYCRDPSARVDLLITPYQNHSPGEVAAALYRRLSEAGESVKQPHPLHGVRVQDENVWIDGRPAHRVVLRSTPSLAVNQTNVAAALTLEELLVAVLPLTHWWQRNMLFDLKNPKDDLQDGMRREAEIAWLARVVGVIVLCSQSRTSPEQDLARHQEAPAYLSMDESQPLRRATHADAERFAAIVQDTEAQWRAFSQILERAASGERDTVVWSISLNRGAFVAINRSVPTTKADAVRRLFNISCAKLCWAVVDSGVDASHPAFEDSGGETRVDKSFDFTNLRSLVSLDSHPHTGPSLDQRGPNSEEIDRAVKRMRQNLRQGRLIDWDVLGPLLEVPDHGRSRPPMNDHGTHVAGIIGARGTKSAPEREGMCPDINLMDLRVLDGDGRGDEFSIIAALQFIRYLNANSDRQVIHGVNLSLSLIHDVENYACGRTPVCEECERLVNSGVVVVVAAGNRGYERVLTPGGELEAYRGISITDPGNGESVITVGSTHRFEPHTYGVSYFSSRGPTGDGRIKPDILAPGEKIESTLPDKRYGPKDGTSMAAPHVSGAAALLMARHTEFIGEPDRIKKIICGSAIDLGRERYFQGAGMVDVLKALQSV